MSRTTRRSALTRGLLAVGGVLGLGAAGAGAAAAGTRELHFVARGWNAAPGRRPGALPLRGDRSTVSAELLDAAAGRTVGRLHAVAFAVAGPGSFGHGTERVELHTLELDGGTIVGSGSVGAEGGLLAVLGGTGRYAGARGTYEVRSHDGGDGGAAIVVTLVSALH